MARHVLVNAKRRRRLEDFAAELEALCDRFAVDLVASRDSEEVIELRERGFRYPDGYEFSATFRHVVHGKMEHCAGIGAPADHSDKLVRGLDIETHWYDD